MKKISVIVLLICLAYVASAGPATPFPVKMKQPDGSFITLRLHGDEHCNWYTSEDGKTVYERGEDLWWRPSSGNKARRKAKSRINQSGLSVNGNGEGNRRVPVLLVEFSDKSFREGAYDYFSRALNEPGFSDNGQYGSVRDYYIEASYGLYTPQFDVMGPVKVSRKSTDKFGSDDTGNNALARQIILDALEKLDPTVDFSVYDCDNDGYLDSVALIFPGVGQEEGGGPDAIWSHMSFLNFPNTFDGKMAGKYFCSPEMSNDWSSFRTIGTFCHEFGHILGLPDLYDVNYDENGSAPHPSFWNLMAAGNHLPIPPRLSTYERYLLGYINSLNSIEGEGFQTIPGLDQGKGFILPASSGGEFFLFEVRNTYGWDSGVPSGLLIYHIDTSQNLVHGYTASSLWVNRQINIYGDHPCYYILNSEGNDNWSSWCINSEPEYTLAEWSGEPSYRLLDVKYDGALNQATFDVKFVGRHISGYVYNKEGKPINGAVVNLLSAGSEAREVLATTTTRSGGYYSFYPDESTPEDLIIAATGRDCISQEAQIHGHYLIKDFTLDSVYLDSSWIDSRATLADFGISYIQAPTGQLHSGDSFPLKLVKSPVGEIETLHWYMDGNEVTEDSVVVSSGRHTIQVTIDYNNIYGDGLESDTVELVINVL